MNGIMHRRNAYAWALLAVVLFAAVSFFVQAQRTEGFDSVIIRFVQGWENDGLTKAMEGLSWLGSTKVVVGIVLAAMILFGFFLGHRGELILLAVVMAGAPAMNRLLKGLFERERPDFHRIAEEAGYSYPSGHSSASFALYGVLAYLLWRHVSSNRGKAAMIVFGVALTASIGISRVYLGVHYPTDVIGGYLASAAWLSIAIGVFRTFAKR